MNYPMIQKKNKFGIRLSPKKMINSHDLYILTNRRIEGLLKVVNQPGLFNTTLMYDTSNYELAIDYLQKPLDEQEFKKMIQSLIAGLSEIEKLYLNINCLLLDFNYIYIDPISEKFYFAYIPHLEFKNDCSLQEFFIELSRYCHFLSAKGNHYVQDYLDLIQESSYFSYHDLNKYIRATPKDDYTPTQVLCSSQETVELNPPVVPCLIRKRNKEKIFIDHTPFGIGTLPVNDYVVDENPAVSRKHILITKVDDQYYIEDLDSTNHTYMKQEILEANQSVLLEEGKLILANEEFEFYYDSLSV